MDLLTPLLAQNSVLQIPFNQKRDHVIFDLMIFSPFVVTKLSPHWSLQFWQTCTRLEYNPILILCSPYCGSLRRFPLKLQSTFQLRPPDL